MAQELESDLWDRELNYLRLKPERKAREGRRHELQRQTLVVMWSTFTKVVMVCGKYYVRDLS